MIGTYSIEKFDSDPKGSFPTVETHIFYKENIEHSQSQFETIGYLEYYLSAYINSAVVPFRFIKKDNETVAIKRSIHSLLCAFILLINIVQGTYNVIIGSTEDIYRNPIMIFVMFANLSQTLFSSNVFLMFWRGQEKVLRFVQLTNRVVPAKRTKMGCFLKICLFWILPLILSGLSALLEFGYWFVIKPASPSWKDTVLCAVQNFGNATSIVFSNFVDVFMLVIAITGYQASIKYNEVLLDLVQNKTFGTNKRLYHGDFSVLTQLAEKIEYFFTCLNGVTSGLCLIWFLLTVPWMAFKLFDSFPGTISVVNTNDSSMILSETIQIVYFWFYLWLYAIIVLLFVETKRKCEETRVIMKRLIFQYDPNLIQGGRAAMDRIDFMLQSAGVNGLYFFQYSYGFLGTITGLLVAYAFIALQLRLASASLYSNATLS